MDKKEILGKLDVIFEDIIDEGSVTLTDASTADDVDGWDSLTNIQLVVEIEKQFDVRFSSEEITTWKNVGDMIDCILQKSKEN